MSDAVTYLTVRVPSWTNVIHSRQHGQWQTPVRGDPAPREVLNSAYRAGPVVLLVALDSPHGFVGYGHPTSEAATPASASSRGCPLSFVWDAVFPARGGVLPVAQAVGNYAAVDADTARSIIVALDAAIAAAVAALAAGPVVPPHPPVRGAAVDDALAWLQREGGPVLWAHWSGARLWDPRTPEPHVQAVFVRPLEHLFGLKAAPAMLAQPRGSALTFEALELSAFCKGLARGDWRCVNALHCAEAPLCVAAAPWKQLVAMRDSFVTRTFVRALVDEARSRSGLRGIEAVKDAGAAAGRITHALRLAQWALVCLGLPLLQGVPDPLAAATGPAFEAVRVEEALQRAEAALVSCALPERADSAALREWLLQFRRAARGDPLPPPLHWETSPTSSIQLCPWPLLVMGKRTQLGQRTGTAAAAPLLGVYIGDADEWIRNSVDCEAGDRGWGPLSLRGRGFVLYELGRFAELVVWGHPYVLELVCVCAQAILHATAEWNALLELAANHALLSGKAIAQVMGAVQAQLQHLIRVGEPFDESAVELAALLRWVREAVVARVGPSKAPDEFGDYLFWRSDVVPLDHDDGSVAESPAAPAAEDGPARRVKETAAVQSNVDVDRSGLREVLVELDELRALWMDAFPAPTQVQERLARWFVDIRLRSFQ